MLQENGFDLKEPTMTNEFGTTIDTDAMATPPESRRIAKALEELVKDYKEAKMPYPPGAVEALWIPIDTVRKLIDYLKAPTGGKE